MDGFELHMKTASGLEESVITALTSAASVMTDALIVKSNEGIILSWNPTASRIFGYEASEVIGRNESILSFNTSKEKEESEKWASKGEGAIRQAACRRHKNGTAVAVSLSAVPLLNELGEITAAAEIIS